MAVTKAQVLDSLRRIKGPDLASNIVDLGMVSDIAVREARVTFAIAIPPSRAEELEPLRQAAEKVVKEMPDVAGVTAVLTAEAVRDGGFVPPKASVPSAAQRPASKPPAPSELQAPRVAPGVPGVKRLIAVASGKGGVGKSTVAVNLALGFMANGVKAGILDADIFGPSQPRLLGLSGRAEAGPDRRIKPKEAYGVPVMSMGFMVEEGAPVVWRGPMVTQALNSMLREVDWGKLDVLVIDMPPGTGDVQLTLAQSAPLAGAVIVSTPQDLALIDARKALAMFQKVNVPILGIVENMSTFVCPRCGERSDIFGHGGAEEEASRLGVPFLGAIPLRMDIRETSDAGRPVAATGGPNADAFKAIAARTWDEAGRATGAAVSPPKFEVNADRDRLTVSFPDGAKRELDAEYLRVMSPSAEVQGHSETQRVTVGGKRSVKIEDLRPVGLYATRIVFDDGHDTGLYTWSYLDELARTHSKRWPAYLAELETKGLARD